MCVLLEARIPATRAGAVTEVPRESGALAVGVRPRWPWHQTTVVEISQDGTCACNMLEDTEAGTAPTWRLQPTLTEPLARAVDRLAREVAVPFDFALYWTGEWPETTLELSVADLTVLIHQNAIGRGVVYRVVPGAAV